MSAGFVRTIRCPRCGYDQRGEVATWEHQCPLRSTCTECGLEMDWRELLNPLWSSAPGWFVEAAGSRRPARVRYLWTWWQSYAPWRFWSKIQMGHPWQYGRLLWYLFFVILFMYGIYVATSLAIAQGTVNSWAGWGSTVRLDSPALQLMKITVAPVVSLPIGQFIDPSGGVLASFTAWDLVQSSWMSVLAVYLWTLVSYFFSAVAFGVLPVSRSRAKVRWGHVIRLGTYGLGLLLVPFAVSAVSVISNVYNWPLDAVFRNAGIGAMLLMLLWLALWWYFGIRLYLRMDHPAAVTASVLILGLGLPVGGNSFYYLFFV